MDRRRTRRLVTVASGVVAASALLVLSALPASAQVPDPGDLIEEVTEDVDDVATDAGDAAGDIVEDVTGTFGDAVGGDAGQTTKDLGSAASDIVRDTTGDAGDLVSETGASVDDMVDDVVGGVIGGSPNDAAPNVGVSTTRGRFEIPVRSSSLSGTTGGSIGADPGVLSLLVSTDVPVDETATTATTRTLEDGSDRSILDALGGITFPLALIAIVAGFLAIQGRFDRQDPKLSLAILDPEDEMLSFR